MSYKTEIVRITGCAPELAKEVERTMREQYHGQSLNEMAPQEFAESARTAWDTCKARKGGAN